MKADCNDRIIEEASELFRIYGIKAVTMDMLAQRLGISKRTIYEKFKDKDELLTTVLVCMMKKQKKMMEGLIASEPNVLVAFFKHGRLMREQFNSVNPVLKSDLKKFHSETMARVKKSCGNQYQNTLGFIVKGMEQGVLRNDINAEIVNRCFQELGRIASDSELFPPEQFSFRDIHKNVLMNYLRGIVTEKGLKVMLEYENDYN